MSNDNNANGKGLDELFRQLLNEVEQEQTKSTSNPVAELLMAMTPLQSMDALKDLNFVVNCEIDGEQRGDRFEPKVSIKFQIARDMDKVLARMALGAKIEKDKFDMIATHQNTEKYLEFLKTAKIESPVNLGIGGIDPNAKPDNHS